LKPEDSQRYENIARSIFALPQVQAASHSFTHPFSWEPGDPNPGHFDRLNVELNEKEKASYPKIDLEREIKGSIDYINARLLPPGKRVELMLWSGNCRELGVENMNGGDTILSRLYPSLSGVAPRMMHWGDEIQIFAANQNEYMYANGFQGPSYGGFVSVIDTFERTDLPRRLKPVNIYYHFYSSTFLSSLRALEKVHDWCMKQPLHPITALEYAQIARDAFRSKIYSVGPDQWLISNAGKLRTFRVPASAGVPDLARCQGVSGYKTEGDVTYIHTTGRTATEVVLTDADTAPQDHLRLVESSAEVTFHELTGRQALFQVGGWSTVDVVFAGIPPGAMVAVTKNKEAGQVKAAADGTLKLSVPPRSTISLNVPCPPYAASR
jgi:polysaccharide biosynthesis protein PelA